MLRAKRLAAVVVASVVMVALTPAAALAARASGAPNPGEPTSIADLSGIQPTSSEVPPLSSDVDPAALLADAASTPDPVAHLPGRAATPGLSAFPTIQGQSVASVVASARAKHSVDETTAPTAAANGAVAADVVDIQGTVTGPDLPDAMVYAKSDTETFSAYIDEAGHYDVPVTPGAYHVGVLFQNQRQAAWYTPGGPVPVSHLSSLVTAPATIDLALPPDQILSGVVGAGGNPAAGVAVDIYDLYFDIVATTYTAADGTYDLLVAPGRYLVGAETAAGYAGVWYASGGSVVSSADADPVTVSNSAVSGINITMPQMQTISGTVYQTSTSRLAGAVIEFWVNGVFWDAAASSSGSSAGSFSVSVPPGSSQMWFWDGPESSLAPGWYAGGTSLTADWKAAAVIRVSTVPVSGLKVIMPAAHTISGSFLCASSQSDVEVDAFVNGSAVSFSETYATTNGRSLFSIPVMSATYTLLLPNRTCGVSVWYRPGGYAIDGADATPVVVGSSNISDIGIDAPAPTGIMGRIENEDGLGLYSIVELYHNGHYYAGSATAGYLGVSVPSASWTVYAFDAAGFYGSGWYSTHGLVRSSSQASLVNSASNPTNIDVVLPYLTVPGKPTGVTAGGFHNGAVVTWSAPADDGGTDITKYTVTSSPAGKTCTSISETRCIVYGLTNGTSYTFTVKATNAVGTGAVGIAFYRES